MARLDMPAEHELSALQAEVCKEALTGRRGKVPTPMVAWLRSPELARRAQKVGELLRFETTLEPHLTEMAILLCARHWTAHVEWIAHKALALKAGLDAQVISAIAARREPVLADEQARAVYGLSQALLATGRVPDALYWNAIERLGERSVVELVGVLGYYCLVSLTLNAFELGSPEQISAELLEGDVPEGPST